MTVNIVEPTEGSITITVPFEEGEVLTRILGMVNTGQIKTHAPVLETVIGELIEQFGRNTTKEADRFTARAGSGQVWLEELAFD